MVIRPTLLGTGVEGILFGPFYPRKIKWVCHGNGLPRASCASILNPWMVQYEDNSCEVKDVMYIFQLFGILISQNVIISFSKFVYRNYTLYKITAVKRCFVVHFFTFQDNSNFAKGNRFSLKSCVQ